MDFDLTEEQRLLKESVDRVVDDAYGDFEKRKEHQRGPRGFSDDLWSTYAELGLLGMPFEERHGGFGGGPVETMIVMEAIGRGLVVEPYLATVVLGGGFLRHGGSEAQHQRLIPKIADGSLTLAFAHLERQARYDLHDVATTARRTDGGGFVLDGAKGVVLHGGSADLLVVSARTSGARRDREGMTLFLVDPKAPGVIRPRTVCARRRSPWTGYASRPGTCSGSWTAACPWSSAWWTSRSPRCAPRRSARWRPCSG